MLKAHRILANVFSMICQFLLKHWIQVRLGSILTGNTGWGQINSLNFKVNSKKTIRDTKILFLNYETTTWEVLNHIVLKIISCKWWPLFAWCLRAERLGDCKTDHLTASMFSGVREVPGRPHLFSDTLPVSQKFSTHNRTDFQSGTRSRGGIWWRARNARCTATIE